MATVVASGQGVSAFGASAPPSPSPDKAQRIAAEQARTSSTEHALGLGSAEKLVVKDVLTDRDGTTNVRYNRTYDGLRVIGGDFVSHRARSGKIKGVSWNGAPEVAVASTTPRLSLSSAKTVGSRKALSRQETAVATKGELVVYSGGTSEKVKPKLAYDVLTTGVRTDQTPSRLHTVVDAMTGATLTSWDEIQNGTGNGIYGGSVSIATTAGPPWSLRDSVGNETTDLDGVVDDVGNVPGSVFTDPDDSWGDGTVVDRASAAVDAHYGAGKTFDYFKNVQGRDGIWGNGAGARSRVHFGDGYVNAFWDGRQVTYGDGAANANPLVELDVVGHEMTHGITENTAGLVGTGEAGGLNEATSDIFGTSIEWYANNPSDNPDYLIGELVRINGDETPLRYQDRPSRDGLSPDCWSPSVGTLDVHYSSGPLNHWFYLASEGSGTNRINEVSYDSPTCGAAAVTAIGREKAARIWYRTLTTYLTSNAGYAAAREGAIQSAKDLYGAGSTECPGVAAAFSAIGVPAGAQTCGVTAPPPSGGNLLGNPGFESGDTLWSASPAVIAQWEDSGQPARTGSWSAWLGGFESTHNDSISQLVSIPASSSATLSYNVHIDTNEAADAPAYDTLTVRAGSTVLQTLSNVNAADGYVLKTLDLSPYVGQTIALSFSGAMDESVATSFVLDDLALTSPSVAVAPGAPTAVIGTPGNTQAAVSWTEPASNGGSEVTGYTVTASPGGRTATSTGTAATLTGLTNGTAYTFTVTATNAAGTSLPSVASAPVTARTVPGAPTGVSAAAGNASAVVSWVAPASNGGSVITGYSVRVRNAATNALVGGLRPAAGTATSLSVTGLANGTLYTFTVSATNVAGTSPESAPAAASGGTPPTVPGAPTGVSAAAGNASAVVSWVAPASNGGLVITGYSVRVRNAATNALVGGLRPAGGAATSLSVTGLANGTAYTFTVSATNGEGTSLFSAASRAVTPRTVPRAPRIGTASAANVSAIVRWTAPANNGSSLTRYSVRVVSVATNRQVGALRSATPGATSVSVRGLTNRTSYRFAVGATNQAGTGAYSALSNAVTPAVTAAVTRLSDFTRDGFTDVVARKRDGVLWLYPGNGAGGFLPSRRMGTGWNVMTALVTPGDVTGDAKADIIARDKAGVLWLYPGNGAGGLSARRRIASGWGSYTIVNAANLNGTGPPDLLVRDSAGALWLYPLSGKAVLGARVRVGSGWKVMTSITGPGDVSGDRRADVLGRTKTGALYLYRGKVAGGFVGGTLVSTGWQTQTALVTPGNWDRALGNDLLARDAAGRLWLHPGNNAGGFGQRRLIGTGWNVMSYIG